MKHFVVVNQTKSILDSHFSASGKAFTLDYNLGYAASEHQKIVWIPKSICQFSEVNEVGNLSILIPMWFFSKNQLDYHRLADFSKIEHI